MGSPPRIPVKGVAAAVLMALGLGAVWLRDSGEVKLPQGDQATTAAAAPSPSAAGRDGGQAAPAPPASSGRVATGPVIDVAPPAEEAVESAAQQAGSFGRRAGLHKVRDDLHLTSSAAVVVDRHTGQVLFRKNEAAVLPIASLTKLMTALVVSDARLPLNEIITITEADVDGERNSRSRLKVGTPLTRGEALQVALMSSENRAAHALGRSFPGGLGNFMRAMNRKAKVLGMQDTVFVDPTGLSSGNQSTARDLSTLAAVAARNPVLAGYTTAKQHLLPVAGGRILRYRNSNRLTKSPQWDISLQKTGYIVEAGWCMVMDARIGGQDLLIVLLDAAGKGSRIADAERIRRWAMSQGSGLGHNAAASGRPVKG